MYELGFVQVYGIYCNEALFLVEHVGMKSLPVQENINSDKRGNWDNVATTFFSMVLSRTYNTPWAHS